MRVVCIWLCTLILSGSIAGCTSRPSKKVCSEPKASEHSVSLTIVRHRFHTGFAFDVADIPLGMLPEIAMFGDLRAVEIGWGDREFYMAPSDDYLLAARALLWPTDSVMHVVGFRKPIREELANNEQVEIAMHKDAFASLIRSIDRTFFRQNGVAATSLRRGLYGESYFFPANGDFYLFRTCNVWVSEVLAEAGCPVSSSGNLHASDVVEEVRPLAIFYKS